MSKEIESKRELGEFYKLIEVAQEIFIRNLDAQTDARILAKNALRVSRIWMDELRIFVDEETKK